VSVLLDSRSGLPASRLQLPAGDWATVLDCLCERFPGIGRAQWLDRMARGRVLDAGGHPVDPLRAFETGLEIRYFREPGREVPIPFAEKVVHADPHLVVADKPHFLAVAPTGRHLEQTLLARLVGRLRNPHLVPLHRIDRDTAGLVMFSADPASRGRYQALFRESRIAKVYECIAAPLPGMEFPLQRRSRLERGEPFHRMREVPGNANSETRMEVLERGTREWRYRLLPASGRKHQFRVQMAALGAAIRNDPLYPDLLVRVEDDFTRPLQLLARSLAFDDPLDGSPREFHSRRELLTLE